MLCNCNAVEIFKHSDESAQKDPPEKSIMTTKADYHLPDGEFVIVICEGVVNWIFFFLCFT